MARSNLFSAAKTAARIKELRRAKGLALSDLGKIIGVNKSTVARWEQGIGIARMKNPVLTKIAEILETSETYLLGYTDEVTPATAYPDGIVETIQSNPKLRILHDRADKLTPEDIDLVLAILDRMEGKK